MKYRLFEGGYEGFLDDRVPVEYQDIVVDELPPGYLEPTEHEKTDYNAYPSYCCSIFVHFMPPFKSRPSVL